METNFFSQIKQLPKAGAWKINIAFVQDEIMLVSVLLEKEADGKALAPIVFNGTAKELDEGFFGAISAPVQSTAELFASVDAHLLSIEKAKNEIKPKTEKKPAENGSPTAKIEDKAERKKRYDGLIEKAKTLNGQMKYEEALAVLPSSEDFPEKGEELDGLRTKLEERKAQKEKMSLFTT
ncbi:PRTRC system protein E [Pedobacter sp. LMG 31464]|uniref:PRTRC system protein E n=1 Tax=Pedobacter planticolens TaxID=2679964 RepID=A0A923E1G5_9SPHI|nr:PRTRC system protein E [Pedobacter planticolens]MBB2145732.1 PRTRC system protein E [Pedobacter planticolens]